MRRILAVDTSTGWGSVALLQQTSDEKSAEPVAEHGAVMRGSHAEHLLGWIERLIDEAGWSKSSIDLYVATRGPGSFTGIRVGLGTVRGLALATGRPCAGVITLEALAGAHGPADRVRIAVMDAGREELFGARYDAVSSLPLGRGAPWLERVSNLRRRIPVAGALLIPGPGTKLEEIPAGCRVASTPRAIAAAAGRIGAQHVPSGDVGSVLSPLYLRAPDAVLKRQATR